ncbi:unknown protein [Seminavis robusta]|uniref:Uncharacterized protein n=1 Tax=Seminavis robusta TaxID=568900 RepID=A0A9N8F0N3_9STRA|nr:unknown protein [Seminavis robusta]|eukprot:Sro2634_g333240.1 n/a (97) ;mRNA; r:71-361
MKLKNTAGGPAAPMMVTTGAAKTTTTTTTTTTGLYSNAVHSGVEMNALFYRLVRAEAECSELRGTITSLQDRIQANEDRIQANEEFLHNSDIPSGF